MLSRGIRLILLTATLAFALPAEADEPWLISLEPSFQLAVGEPQSDWFSPGLSASLAIHRALNPSVLVGVKLRGGFLFNGSAPSRDSGFADPGVGTLSALTADVRFRPFHGQGASRGTGLWVEGGGGIALTGDLWRGIIDVGVGYGFAVGSLDIGPAVRYLHVVQPNDQLESHDAHLILFGIEVTFLDARTPPVEPEPTPPGDRDHDGYLDPDDGCPDEPEDFDDFEDEDGCPDPDNDQDGILDVDDDCPMEPEDLDGFEDEDGCPDPDNDQDYILDVDDACPNEPETVNGIDDEDGCPDQGLIEMVDDRIVLDERVLFDFQRARVKSRARPIIDAIVYLAAQHPEWTRIRVEGHADIRGNEDYNLRLSERRSRNVVRALSRAGMQLELFEHRGFGSSQPRESGSSEDAHQRNRRVEFVVVARRSPEESVEDAGVEPDVEEVEGLEDSPASVEIGDEAPEGIAMRAEFEGSEP